MSVAAAIAIDALSDPRPRECMRRRDIPHPGGHNPRTAGYPSVSVHHGSAVHRFSARSSQPFISPGTNSHPTMSVGCEHADPGVQESASPGCYVRRRSCRPIVSGPLRPPTTPAPAISTPAIHAPGRSGQHPGHQQLGDRQASAAGRRPADLDAGCVRACVGADPRRALPQRRRDESPTRPSETSSAGRRCRRPTRGARHGGLR
jgi:hypothetical protein